MSARIWIFIVTELVTTLISHTQFSHKTALKVRIKKPSQNALSQAFRCPPGVERCILTVHGVPGY